MRPVGRVEVEFLRDGRGLELACVTLGAASRWVTMAEGIVLAVVRRGHGAARCRGDGVELREGVVRVCSPCELAVVETQSVALELALLQVPKALLRGAPSASAEPLGSDDALAERASTVVAQWRSDRRAAGEHDVDALLSALPSAGALARGRLRPAVLEPGAVRRARLLLERRFRTTPSLDELVEESGGSKFHLARSFRAYHGVPPHTYLNYYRLAIARTLLASGARGSDAAVATGFADQSHFSRSFRRLIGVSPLAYARAGQPAAGRRARSDEHGAPTRP